MYYSPKAIALSLLLGLALSARAAEPAKPAPAVPAEASAKKACTTSTGATKSECEKVAAKIDAHTANPQANPSVDSDRAPAQEMHHSSPIMVTPQEKAATEQTRRELKKEAKQVEAAKKDAAEKPVADNPPKE